MTHDERIEAMARAMHAADVEPRRFDPHWTVRDFEELNCIGKGWWHRMAIAALAAAGVAELEAERDALRAAFRVVYGHATNGDLHFGDVVQLIEETCCTVLDQSERDLALCEYSPPADASSE
jgi:hypothetical protein